MAFDINAQDGTGQTSLYLACVIGNIALVKLLLGFKVQASKIKVSKI